MPHFLHLLLQTLQSFKADDKEVADDTQKQLVIKPGSLPMLPPPGFRGPPPGFRGETARQHHAINAGVQPAVFLSCEQHILVGSANRFSEFCLLDL